MISSVQSPSRRPVLVEISNADEQEQIERRMKRAGSNFKVRFVRRQSNKADSPFAQERARAFDRMQARRASNSDVAVREAFLASLNGASL